MYHEETFKNLGIGMSVSGLRLDSATFLVHFCNQSVRLTKIEFEILKQLFGKINTIIIQFLQRMVVALAIFVRTLLNFKIRNLS